MTSFSGFDHVDCRVSDLAAVERFYDALMPRLGLTEKSYALVDEAGNWHEASLETVYNAVEFSEPAQPGRATFFFGIIEDDQHRPAQTRIAFRVERAALAELERLITALGARAIEHEDDFERYPAVFFEDPAGTKLELVARSF